MILVRVDDRRSYRLQVKLREMTILDLQKKIAESDARLKQQQHLYEAVHAFHVLGTRITDLKHCLLSPL